MPHDFFPVNLSLDGDLAEARFWGSRRSPAFSISNSTRSQALPFESRGLRVRLLIHFHSVIDSCLFRSEELFYQLGLRQFGNYARLKLEPPPPIRHLVRLAVRAESERWKECGLDIEADEVVDVSL